MNHYVRTNAIMRGIVEGRQGRALCGVYLVPTGQGAEAIPGDEVANRNLTTCPECELFYSALFEDAETRESEDVFTNEMGAHHAI